MLNEEIKEILDDLENVSYLPNISYQLNHNKVKKLYDYITNLQQENERLKKEIPSPDNCVPIEKQMRISNVSHDINYKYFKTLYEKATKDIVIDDLVYKCEDMQKLIETNEKIDIQKEDYKSRCEKAAEYIIEHRPYEDREYLLNLLGNESDEE